MKHGGGSTMILGCFKFNSRGKLKIIQEPVNATKYVQILQYCLQTSIENLERDLNGILNRKLYKICSQCNNW